MKETLWLLRHGVASWPLGLASLFDDERGCVGAISIDSKRKLIPVGRSEMSHNNEHGQEWLKLHPVWLGGLGEVGGEDG